MTNIKQLLASTTAKAEQIKAIQTSLAQDLYNYLEDLTPLCKSIILKKPISYNLLVFGKEYDKNNRWIVGLKKIQQDSDLEPTWYLEVSYTNSIFHTEDDIVLLELVNSQLHFIKAIRIPAMIELIEKNRAK